MFRGLIEIVQDTLVGFSHVSHLVPQLPSTLVGNKGYRKYLGATGRNFHIDEEKVKAESRFDGKWVLRTNTSVSAVEVAQKYKQLWMVEQLFRSANSIMGNHVMPSNLQKNPGATEFYCPDNMLI